MKTFNLLFLGGLLLSLSACTSNDVSNELLQSENIPKTERGVFITLNSGAVVEKKGDLIFFGDDVVLSDSQLERLDKTGTFFFDPKEMETFKPLDSIIVSPAIGMRAIYGEVSDNNTVDTRSVGRHPYEDMYWSMVRFTWGDNLDYFARMQIVDAIHYIQNNTNIRFYNATGQPTSGYGIQFPYIEFINSDDLFVSWSYCGRIGGKQNLAVSAFASMMTVVHELGHAVGMYHEHQRIDRDNYITVNLNNVDINDRPQFNKISTYVMSNEFDWNSIMLYDSYMFSSNNNPTMVRKSNGLPFTSNSSSLSNIDRMWMNNFYIPYIARSDTYAELAETVYWPDNTIMTPQERFEFQAYLNNGNPYPPSSGRIPNIISYYD